MKVAREVLPSFYEFDLLLFAALDIRGLPQTGHLSNFPSTLAPHLAHFTRRLLARKRNPRRSASSPRAAPIAIGK